MHPTYQYILNLLEDNFPNKRKISLIDYGCGNGLLLEFLPNEKISSYKGFDINLDSINYAKRHYESKKILFNLLRKEQKNSLGSPKSVDVIVLIGVLQYMTQKEISDFLINAKKTLKKNGIILISCTTDHFFYRVFNLYRLFLPNYFININKLSQLIRISGLRIKSQKEKGILLSPLFSNVFSVIFDTLDKIFFQTRGSLGFFGRISRDIVNPLLRLEYLLPLDHGYTLFLVLEK